jgi:hypothetical protein
LNWKRVLYFYWWTLKKSIIVKNWKVKQIIFCWIILEDRIDFQLFIFIVICCTYFWKVARPLIFIWFFRRYALFFVQTLEIFFYAVFSAFMCLGLTLFYYMITLLALYFKIWTLVIMLFVLFFIFQNSITSKDTQNFLFDSPTLWKVVNILI